MSNFRKALLGAAIPIVALSVISMVGVGAAGYDEGSAIIFGLIWIGGALYFVGAIIALIIFTVAHQRQIVAGILAGLGVGIISLGATCFAGNALSGGSWF